jgi:hypothetical protein
MLILAAAAMPLSASAQHKAGGGGGAGAGAAAAPAAHIGGGGGARFGGGGIRAGGGGHFSAPHASRGASPRISAHGAAPSSRSAVSASRAAARQEHAQRLQDQRAVRALPRQQRAQRLQDLRQQRLDTRQAQPNAQTSARRNGQARVTAQAARQGRFAARFHTRAERNARVANIAARQAWRRGWRAGFVPWFGPVFWPYAYADIFGFAFWPYGYDDGFWAYAYDDFFDGVFWGEAGPPQAYADAAPLAQRTPRASYAAVQSLCKQPGNGVTAWPFADIERKVNLSDEQKQLLGDVRTAGQKAADDFKTSCPAETAFPLTPPGRLDAMTSRLDATLAAVQTVRPALDKFYGSLSDEQKERFNAVGPMQPKDNAAASMASAQQGDSCKEPKAGLTNLPMEKIEDAVKPTDAQAGQLKQLEDATGKAVSIMQAACPDDVPLTPPGRLEVMEKRLQAMIDAAKTVKPALETFYSSLDGEQKARFDRIGGQLAQAGG